MAGNTPFKRWKREVHEGGVADPCIVSWPARFGGDVGRPIRHQFAHAIDVLPTVLELAGVEARRQTIEESRSPTSTGSSFAYLLGRRRGPRQSGTSPSTSRCSGREPSTTEAWKAVTFHPVGPLYDDGLDPNAPFDDDVWELYHVADDVAEIDDLRPGAPTGWPRMVDIWWQEADATRCCRSTTACSGRSSIRSPTAAGRGRAFATSKAARRCPRPSPSTSGTARTRSSSTSTCPTAPSRTACCSPSALARRVVASPVGGRLRYVHNLYGKRRHVLEADRALGPGATRRGSTSTRTQAT